MRRAMRTDGQPCLVFTLKFLPALGDCGWIVANHAYARSHVDVGEAQDDTDEALKARAFAYLRSMTKAQAIEVIREEHHMNGYGEGADFMPPDELVALAKTRVRNWWPG